MQGLGAGLFCEACGRLCVLPAAGEHIECAGCGRQTPLTALRLSPRLDERLFTRGKEWLAAQDWSWLRGAGDRVVEQRCVRPGCSSERCYYSAVQTRSADEGQTVFYECAGCGERFTLQT